MAHFAELDKNNTVLRVIVVADDLQDGGEDWCKKIFGGAAWKKTSYNTAGGVHLLGGIPFRMNYAGIGYKYDADLDAFIPPQPFPSWTLNIKSCLWECPVPMPPDDGKVYCWDEEKTSWVSQ